MVDQSIILGHPHPGMGALGHGASSAGFRPSLNFLMCMGYDCDMYFERFSKDQKIHKKNGRTKSKDQHHNIKSQPEKKLNKFYAKYISDEQIIRKFLDQIPFLGSSYQNHPNFWILFSQPGGFHQPKRIESRTTEKNYPTTQPPQPCTRKKPKIAAYISCEKNSRAHCPGFSLLAAWRTEMSSVEGLESRIKHTTHGLYIQIFIPKP